MGQHRGWAFLLVFVGGGIGSVLRHIVNQVSASLLGTGFPWGTMFVNISGSFIMGLFAGWFAFRGEGGGQLTKLFLTTGILGGYTTFSTFALDTALLWDRGQQGITAIYAGGSVIVGVLGVFAGIAAIKALAL